MRELGPRRGSILPKRPNQAWNLGLSRAFPHGSTVSACECLGAVFGARQPQPRDWCRLGALSQLSGISAVAFLQQRTKHLNPQ